MWWWPTLQKEGEEGEKTGGEGKRGGAGKGNEQYFLKNNEICLDFVVTEDKHACVKYTVQ